MREIEFQDRVLFAVLEEDASEADWLEARAEGVTGSQAHEIAHGGVSARRRILADKLNGSTFRGTVATREGHAREAGILTEAERETGSFIVATPRLLLCHWERTLHRVTPDGLGTNYHFGAFGVEAKWHEAGYGQNGIPVDHLAQCQWGMHVTGFSWWLYVWRVGDDPVEWEWVPRDDRLIAKLAAEADNFIAWREAGAPDVDDLPAEVDTAIADYVRGLQLETQGAGLKKAARPIIEAHLRASRVGDQTARAAGTAGAATQSVTIERVLDEAAWARRAPKGYAAWLARKARAEQAVERVREIADDAALTYYVEQQREGSLRVTPNKEKSE